MFVTLCIQIPEVKTQPPLNIPGLSFSLPYVQLAFPLAFFRTPQPITVPETADCSHAHYSECLHLSQFNNTQFLHSTLRRCQRTMLSGFPKHILNHNQRTLGLSWEFFLYLSVFISSCSHPNYTSYFDL